ncbi:Sec-independent protein translocase protein TatB [Vreelandella sp. EE27]
MLDIGFLELMLIGIVALLVLGPERLPKAARTTGMWIGKIKRTVSGMQREISAQLEAEELRQKISDQQKKLDSSLKQAKRDVESIASAPAASSSSGTPGDDTDKRVAKAAARLDDALEEVHESPEPSSQASTEESARPESDELKKDSNPS